MVVRVAGPTCPVRGGMPRRCICAFNRMGGQLHEHVGAGDILRKYRQVVSPPWRDNGYAASKVARGKTPPSIPFDYFKPFDGNSCLDVFYVVIAYLDCQTTHPDAYKIGISSCPHWRWNGDLESSMMPHRAHYDYMNGFCYGDEYGTTQLEVALIAKCRDHYFWSSRCDNVNPGGEGLGYPHMFLYLVWK